MIIRIFVVFFLCCLSAVCYGQDAKILQGEWTEYWYSIKGGDDAYTMRVSVDAEGNISMESVNDDAIVEVISYDEGVLIFRKVDIEGIEDEEGNRTSFYMYYSLVVIDDKTMKGGLVDSKECTSIVIWTKTE